jgi:hypothetical protein
MFSEESGNGGKGDGKNLGFQGWVVTFTHETAFTAEYA